MNMETLCIRVIWPVHMICQNSCQIDKTKCQFNICGYIKVLQIIIVNTFSPYPTLLRFEFICIKYHIRPQLDLFFCTRFLSLKSALNDKVCRWQIKIHFTKGVLCFGDIFYDLQYRSHHQSILPWGRSFTANSGTKATVLLKGRSSTADSGTHTAVFTRDGQVQQLPVVFHIPCSRQHLNRP